MSFLSGFYTRFAAALGQPADADNHSPHSETPDAPSQSSRTLSPDEEAAAHDRPDPPQAPPTPFFAAPSTPFGGAPSPVHQQAAAQQLQREIMGVAPRTPAPFHLARATPMTRYHTPALPRPTPTAPSTVQTSKRAGENTFHTPVASPSKRQRVQRQQRQQQQQQQQQQQEEEEEEEEEDSQMVLGDLELESHTEGTQEESEASTSPDAHHTDTSSSEAEGADTDTSSTSVSSNLSDHATALAIPSRPSRKHIRRPRAARSKSHDARTRVKKAPRPPVSRSISGREELLNRARRRFWDRKADGERLF